MAQYLFIDGAFFDHFFSSLLNHMFPDESLFTAIDLRKLSQNYDRVFYYDALPARKVSESEELWRSRHDQKEEVLNMLSMSPNIHVRSGVSRYRKRRGLEQKGVDILLATDVLQHAAFGNMDGATLMLSDLDFYPIFDALVQTRVKSTLAYDPRKTSRELIYVADIAVPLNAVTLNGWLRNDLSSPLSLSYRSHDNWDDFTEIQKAKCGSRTIIIGKRPDEYFVAKYDNFIEGDQERVGKKPYLLLSSFEDAPGRKVTGAEDFGFP